jgi:hypothetical protein
LDTHTLENGFEKLKKEGKFPALPDDNYNGASISTAESLLFKFDYSNSAKVRGRSVIFPRPSIDEIMTGYSKNIIITAVAIVVSRAHDYLIEYSSSRRANADISKRRSLRCHATGH